MVMATLWIHLLPLKYTLKVVKMVIFIIFYILKDAELALTR